MTPLLTDADRATAAAVKPGPTKLPAPRDLDEGPLDRPRWPERLAQLVRSYPRPVVMLGLLLVSLAGDWYLDGLGDPLALVVVAIGSIPLVRDTVVAIRQRRYALDYLALLAIAASIAAVEFQVGAVVALMLASGKALEDFGVRRARRSLSLLADRIPRTALVQRADQPAVAMAVDDIDVGETVLVRHGEVLPLDATLRS